jgi:NitT/TauT family transport system ATP-binding protein
LNDRLADPAITEEMKAPTLREQSAEPAILFEEVVKVFKSRRGDVQALAGIDFSMAEGEFVSLVGPSGCGKSTLLRMVAGLDMPSSGRVLLNGEPIYRPPAGLGLVFQRDVLFDWRTVLDNVLLPFEMRGGDPKLYRNKASALLASYGLDGFQNRYPWELSGGMRQRVAICRAVIDRPRLLLMDEPFAALDAFTRDELNLELQRLWLDHRATAMFVTHSIQEAVFLAGKVVVMGRSPGRVVDIVEVPLPRPRSLAVRETAEFAALCSRIRRTFEDLGLMRTQA